MYGEPDPATDAMLMWLVDLWCAISTLSAPLFGPSSGADSQGPTLLHVSSST